MAIDAGVEAFCTRKGREHVLKVLLPVAGGVYGPGGGVERGVKGKELVQVPLEIFRLVGVSPSMFPWEGLFCVLGQQPSASFQDGNISGGCPLYDQAQNLSIQVFGRLSESLEQAS